LYINLSECTSQYNNIILVCIQYDFLETSDANVATVDNGVVTAVGKGEATITATAGGKTAETVITVLPIVTGEEAAELLEWFVGWPTLRFFNEERGNYVSYDFKLKEGKISELSDVTVSIYKGDEKIATNALIEPSKWVDATGLSGSFYTNDIEKTSSWYVEQISGALGEDIFDKLVLRAIYDGKVYIVDQAELRPIEGNVKNLTQYKGYDTIQAAIAYASHGDVIFVSPGTYEENLSIDKPLELLGAGRDDTIVQAVQGRNYNDGDMQSPVVMITSNDVLDGITISGFTFQGHIPEANPGNPTGVFDGWGNTGLNGLSTHGILSFDMNSIWPPPERYNITITNNKFVYCGGVDLYNVTGFEISNNIMVRESHQIPYYVGDDRYHDKANGGKIAHLSNCKDGVIENNEGYTPKDVGVISIAGGSNIDVVGNCIIATEPLPGDTGFSCAGIRVWNKATDVVVSENTVKGFIDDPALSYYYGAAVLIENSSCEVTGNVLEDSDYGVTVDKISEEQSVSLTGNTITGCATGILLTETCGETGTQISGNTFEENAVHVQDNRTVAPANYLAGLLPNNTFPDDSAVVGTKIKVPDWADYADTSWYNDPSATSFTIDTAAKLAGLAELVNGGKDFNGKTINLGADIDLEGIAWIPIGTGSNVFKGNFDGDGKKISNLNINRITSYNGLFGNSSNGKLENVTLENINILIYTPDVTNYAYTGSLAGKAQHVNNVTVTGSINIEVTGGARYVGGIVGHLYNGHMSNCELNSNDGVGLISAKYDVGALAGYVYYGTSITNSTVRNMRINGYLGVGGVSGRIQNEYGAFLLENINIENIILGKLNQGVESSCVGGFLGYPYQSITVTIKDSQLKDVRIESSHIYNGLFYGLYSNTEQYGKVILENVNYSGDCTTQSGEYDYLRKAVGLQKGETVKYYSPIKTAIAAYENAENGDYTIIIKDGTYKEDSIMIRQQVDKSLTIKAENNLKAIFVNENTADSTGIFHISGGSNYDTGAVTFEGIRFELPAGANIDCFGIKLLGESDGGTIHRYASNVTVRNCEFIGNVEKSCAVWSGAGSQPKNILIEGCKGDGLTALYNGYGNGITIKNSQLTNARGLLNSQSTESANELVIEGVEATIDYQPSKDMDAIKINGGNLTIKNSNITMNYNGATRSSGLLVIRGGSTITIEDSTLTTSKVGGDYDVYTFYGMNPANRSNTVFGVDIEDFTYGGTFEQDVTNIVEELEAAVSTFNDAKQEVIDEDEIGVPGEGEEPEDEEEPEELDIAPLDAAIEEAIAAKEGIVVSEDGTDVPAGTYWVAQADMDTLDEAIAAAEADKETAETQQDVAEAVEALEAAVSTFNDAKQEVIDEEEIGVPGEGEESVQAEEPAEDEKSVEDEEAVEGEEQEE
jgi:hypothetical protein